MMGDERDPSLCSGEAERRHELFEQFNKLIAGEACALDDLQRQAAPQVSVVPGHDDAATVAGTPHDDVTARLMIDLEARTFQGTYNLEGFQRRQA